MSAIHRQQLVEKCFQRGQQLSPTNASYCRSVEALLRWLVASDEIENDVTTQALRLDRGAPTTATVVAKQAGTLAGMDEVRLLLKGYPDIAVEACAEDGSYLSPGQAILSLSVGIGALLGLERTLLNILGRMSGIATQTGRLAALLGRAPGGPLIAATRKTPWMLLDKKAVYLGGGLTHRLSLGDAILVKDNHLAAYQKQSGGNSVEAALPGAIERLVQAAEPPLDSFEVEVESVSQARAAFSAFEAVACDSARQTALIIMLDNFGPDAAAQFIREIRSHPAYARVLFEASGDITEETLPAWSGTGVDVLSIGALTHSARNFNLSMSIR